MSDEKLNQLMDEYKQYKELYNDFCNTIIFLLNKFLNNNSFQFQVVSARVKEEISIRNKFIENKALITLNSITELDDLAGCRVIFYLDSEIKKFMQHIYQEFEVTKNNLKYSEDDYNAYHLVIKFKEDRLTLTEYSQFKDLKCELQLTTVLYHAWSEISHNIKYKSPKELIQFDKEKMDVLNNQLKDIMKNFIKPANYKFEFINREYLDLLEGKKIFEVNYLREILVSEDRREMYGKILLLVQYLKKYGDRTPTNYKLTDFVVEVINHSVKLNTIKPEAFGYGYEHRYIVIECIEILNIVKYQYPDQVFPILVELALDKVVKDKALEVIKRMVKYNLNALKVIGMSMQFYILDQIKKWRFDMQLSRIEIISCILKEIFELEYESNEMLDYKTFSFGFGLLQENEDITRIRQQAIQVLFDLYELSTKPLEKLMIIDILEEATKTPNRGNYSEKMESIVIKDTVLLINWYTMILKNNTSLEIIKEIDVQANWFHRRFASIEGLTELIQQIKTNDKYLIYKDLVGYDTDYSEEDDWRKGRELRIDRIKLYIEEISLGKDDKWTCLIVEICKGFNMNQQGKYTYFNQFLFEIAKQIPSYAKELITINGEDIEIFLYHFIAGLKISDQGFADRKMNEWINDEVHLLSCVRTFLYSERVEMQMLERIFEKAVLKNNEQILNEIFRLLNTSKIDKQEGKSLFIKVIKKLSESNDYWWTNYLWLDEESILNNFDASEHDQILEVLINCPQIDHHVEQILIPISKINPEKIIELFEKRIKSEKDGKALNSRYDAIPFHLNELSNIFREKPESCITIIFEWFKKNDWLFKVEASSLFHKIFPSFDEPLQTYLLDIIRKKDLEEADIILEILNKYEGDFSIYEFSQQFIITFHDEPKLLRKLMYALSRTGVVSGEYGFVDAYKRIKKTIRKWNKSKNEVVRNFVKDFIDYLNMNITFETKRSDENIRLMQDKFEVYSK